MANIFDQFHTPTPAPAQGGNIFDQFHAPTPTTQQAAQRAAQPSTEPSTPPVSNPPMPVPRPSAAGPGNVQPENVFVVVDPPRSNRAAQDIDVSQRAPGREFSEAEMPFPDDPPVPGAPPGHFSRSFWNTVLEQNPTMVASAMESFSRLSGKEGTDPLATVFGSFSRDIRGAIPQMGQYKPSGVQFTDIDSLDALNRWFQESAGQAIGSSVMSVVPAIGGAAVGGRVGGRTGAVAGTAIGAGMGSFVPAQGEVYDALKKAGVDEERAARAAVPAAMVIAGLDSFTPAGLVAKLGGKEAVKDEAKKFILRRIVEATAHGAKKEGVTEALQEAVKELDVSITADKEFWTADNLKGVINAGAAGAVGGGAMMGPTGVMQNKVSTPATPEQINQVAEATATPIPPIAPEPVTPAAPVDQRIIQTFKDAGDVQLGKPDVFYSPVKRFVEEKGQNIATPEQWENTLRNAPGIKQEEITDLGLADYFAEAKERGEKITKGDLVRELEERAITVEERHLEGQTDDPINRGTPQYGPYTLPGESSGYTELLLHLPPQAGQEQYVAPHFGNVGQAGNTPNLNLLAHTRLTERTDRDGVPVAVIEEIQSDWHQAGRKQGYASNDPALKEKAVEAFNKWKGLQASGASTAQITAAWSNYQKALEPLEGPPNAPFKSSWDELTFKRVLRWAADKGYRRVAIVNSAEQNRRYPGGSAEQARGMQEFYDKKMPSLMKKWAKRLGGTMTVSKFGHDQTFGMSRAIEPNPGAAQGGLPFMVVNNTTNGIEQYFFTQEEAQEFIDAQNRADQMVVPTDDFITIELPDHGMDKVKLGLPMYRVIEDPELQGVKNNQAVIAPDTAPNLVELAEQFIEPLDELLRAFNLDKKLQLFLHPGTIIIAKNRGIGLPQTYSGMYGMLSHNVANTWYDLHVAVGTHKSAAQIWATIVHELGHAIQFEHFDKSSNEIKSSIRAAYDEWRNNITPDSKMRNFQAQRYNFIAWLQDANQPMQDRTLKEMMDRNYWTSFEEWFAEQVARWATTSQQPLSIVEKWFSGLAKTLMKFWAEALDKFGIPFRPSEAVEQYLNSFAMSAPPFARDIYRAHDFLTKQDNQAVMGEHEIGVEMQPETAAIRDRLNKIFEGGWFKWPFHVRQAVAYADKFNKLYKYALGIHQVAQRNPHIQTLQAYTEIISVAQLTKQQIMSRAHEVVKQWNKLGGKRSDTLAALIDDVQNMVYRTPAEVKAKVVRHPTPQEVKDLIAKHNVDAQTLEVFDLVRETFSEHLTRYEAILMKEAQKITDPIARQARIESIALQIAALRNKPYFPAMRFGNYTITIRNKAGSVIHFETFETKGRRNLAAKDLQKQMTATDKIQLGYLAEQAQPLLGVPTTLLDLMAEKLSLAPKQRDALEQLKFELSPAQSFRHRFQHKRKIAGYSMDFRRAYANYFFHGANHMMKVMYADDLRSLTERTRKEITSFDATKRHQINNYMADHLKNWLDPKSDWQAIRSIAFLWSLAFSPAAAAQNLSQTVMTTYPFLATKFGDHKAVPQIMRTLGQLSTFYKKGKLEELTDFDYRALSRGIQEGVITEAMAPELAAIAEGENFKGVGGNAAQQLYYKFNELGAYMFQMAEQFNRRVVFRATLKLALANPDAKYVQEMKLKHKLKYDELRAEGWTESDAAAYVAAVDATQETQFRYGREFQPRFMRGKARSILVFKTFITSYIVFLGHYPGAAVRSILLLAFLGGLMAIPGADDVKEIARALMWQLFDKDVSMEKAVRELVIEWLGNDEKGRQNADFILHGAARKGFGIPQFMDMLGGTVLNERDLPPEQRAFRSYIPMPTFDRSRAISAGTLLPVELGKLFGPPLQDQSQVIADQAQKASGAVFGAGFNIYKAVTNERIDWNDSKRWERAVPRALGSVMRAGRYYTEGRERTQDGSTLVSYNPRDTEQLAEIIGVAAGYQPFRQSMKWDTVIAQREAIKLFDIRRQTLMRQFYNAAQGKDQKEIERMRGAIKDFNQNLPPEARGKSITSDSLNKSMQSRARNQAAREAESSVRRSDVPIMRRVQELYPESRAIIRKVQ